VRLLSAAGTGFFYTATRPRLAEKMVLRKYDPVGAGLKGY
jgi:ribosomal protein L33